MAQALNPEAATAAALDLFADNQRFQQASWDLLPGAMKARGYRWKGAPIYDQCQMPECWELEEGLHWEIPHGFGTVALFRSGDRVMLSNRWGALAKSMRIKGTSAQEWKPKESWWGSSKNQYRDKASSSSKSSHWAPKTHRT